MAESVYETKAGAICRDGATWVPADPANVDYQRYLADSGKTHEQVTAELKAEETVVEKTLKTERNKQKALRVSARAKLVALGFTGPEIKAFFREADD